MPSIRLSFVLALVVSACASQPQSHECSTGIVCPAPMQCAAVQQVCIVNDCGNGHVDPGEQCDDGNILAGDGCSPTCAEEKCGNGVLDPGEVCDDGNVAPGDGCSPDCKSLEICGNGIKDYGEVCDDGNTKDADGCSANCLSTEVCGNCVVDHEVGEVCDNCGTPSASCSANCESILACGNMTVDTGEECDNGLANDTDDNDCRSDCEINRCGDGFIDSSGTLHHEDCDPAPKVTAGSHGASPVETMGCNLDCTQAMCGDGKVNGTAGEACDKGTDNNDQADCTTGCTVNVCGDGHPDTMGPNYFEACDTGGNSQTCNADCTVPSCGDHKVNRAFTPTGAPGPEQCDDGNNVNGDGCSANCQLEHCGNGIIDVADGEECDGAPVGGFACSSSCHLEKCGNGVLDPGEQCDDGNKSDTDDCISSGDAPSSCKKATCGDGKIDGLREQCDDGTGVNGTIGSACSATCHNAFCGNGVIEQGEQCDDGPGNNGTHKHCNSSCQINTCGDGDILTGQEQCDTSGSDTSGCNGATCTFAVCGDGYPNTAAGEGCDHGNTNGTIGDTCDAFCHTVGCGNGIVEQGEECDPGMVGMDSATCTKNCKVSWCGDNYTNTVNETCDQGSANGTPCAYGSPGCTRCAADCKSTISPGGPFCGDTVTQSPTEVCDDGPANGDTACPYGTKNCNICAADCKTDPLRHGDVCGDGHRDTTFEACDDGNTTGCGLCSSDCRVALASAVQATGTIVTPAGSGLATSGQTFTLNDGFGHTVTFEFTTTGATGSLLADGNIGVAFTAAKTATEVGTEIKNAIIASAVDISVTATNGGIVSLANDHFSALGNHPILTANASVGFGVLGMTGGAGGTCSNGIACTAAGDCASGVCSGGICVSCDPTTCAASGGTCSGTSCVINVTTTAAVTCGAGLSCQINCNSDTSCQSTVDCSSAAACTIECKGNHSCDGGAFTCGASNCTYDFGGAGCGAHSCGSGGTTACTCTGAGCTAGSTCP